MAAAKPYTATLGYDPFSLGVDEEYVQSLFERLKKLDWLYARPYRARAPEDPDPPSSEHLYTGVINYVTPAWVNGLELDTQYFPFLPIATIGSMDSDPFKRTLLLVSSVHEVLSAHSISPGDIKVVASPHWDKLTLQQLLEARTIVDGVSNGYDYRFLNVPLVHDFAAHKLRTHAMPGDPGPLETGIEAEYNHIFFTGIVRTQGEIEACIKRKKAAADAARVKEIQNQEIAARKLETKRKAADTRRRNKAAKQMLLGLPLGIEKEKTLAEQLDDSEYDKLKRVVKSVAVPRPAALVIPGGGAPKVRGMFDSTSSDEGPVTQPVREPSAQPQSQSLLEKIVAGGRAGSAKSDSSIVFVRPQKKRKVLETSSGSG